MTALSEKKFLSVANLGLIYRGGGKDSEKLACTKNYILKHLFCLAELAGILQ
jgi:hypothetical protein